MTIGAKTNNARIAPAGRGRRAWLFDFAPARWYE
jgi:hypothetical protein